MFGIIGFNNYNYEVTSTPNKDLAVSNKVYFNNVPEFLKNYKYIKINSGKSFVYKYDLNENVSENKIALNLKQREDCETALDKKIEISPYTKQIEKIRVLTVNIDGSVKLEIDCNDLTEKIKGNLETQPLSTNQNFTILFFGRTLTLQVLNIVYDDDKTGKIGLFDEDTTIIYTTTKPYINLINQASSTGVFKSGESLSSLAVGGLSEQTNQLFVKALISRINPEISKELGIKHTKGILLYGPPGCGKCLGKDTPILMYDGTIKLVQDVAIGDKLMGDDSKPREVLSLARGKEQMYKIKQEEGDDYVVNESHILSMRMTKSKKFKKTKTAYKIQYFSEKEFVYRKKTFNFSDYKSKEIAQKCALEMLNNAENVDVVDIALTKYLRIQRDPRRALKGYKVPVSFEKKELKHDPYITGLLLATKNIINENTKLKSEDLEKINFLIGERELKINLEGNIETEKDEYLETINLDSIPHENKANSKNARIRLLAGLIDAKGDLYKKTFRFSTTNEKFANDVIFICRSLGFTCTANKVILPNSQYIRIKFTGYLSNKIPCVLERNICKDNVKYDLNTVITVEKLGIDEYYGFEIDGNRRFLLGDFTVTHNTLMAREIGKVLNCVEPIIVNGPELLNKYHGQSEENVRNLFAPAKADTSGRLHVIIVDEADALCKSRGSGGSGSLGDNIVNQFLTEIDGYKTLSNILLIFMTNRKDLLDDAILRPGRIELHIEIGLPDEKGREEILLIHTKSMRESNHLAENVVMKELAKITENFTGAELEKICCDAARFALSKTINMNDSKNRSIKKINPIVTLEDFYRAISELIPLFGRVSNEIQSINKTDFIYWTNTLELMHSEMLNKISSVKTGSKSTILVFGKSYIGKTKFVSNVVKESNVPCVKMITIDKLIRSPYKAGVITNTFETCLKASNSILILDGFERLIEWLRIGPRFNNEVLQIIISILTCEIDKNKKMTIICTAHNELYTGGTLMDELGVSDLFDTKYEYPELISNLEISESFPDLYQNSEFNENTDVSNIFKLMKYVN